MVVRDVADEVWTDLLKLCSVAMECAQRWWDYGVVWRPPTIADSMLVHLGLAAVAP